MKPVVLCLAALIATRLAWGFDAREFAAVANPLQNDRVMVIQKSLAAHPIVRGDFQQELKMPGLKPGQKTTGHFVYSQGKGIVWQVRKPQPLTLTITTQGIRQVQANRTLTAPDGNAKTFSPAFSEGFLSLFRGDFATLEKRFDFSLRDGKTEWQLALEPQSKSLRKNLARMVLAGSDHLNGITLYSARHTETQIIFSNVDLSQTPLTAEEARLLDS